MIDIRVIIEKFSYFQPQSSIPLLPINPIKLYHKNHKKSPVGRGTFPDNKKLDINFLSIFSHIRHFPILAIIGF